METPGTGTGRGRASASLPGDRGGHFFPADGAWEVAWPQHSGLAERPLLLVWVSVGAAGVGKRLLSSSS